VKSITEEPKEETPKVKSFDFWLSYDLSRVMISEFVLPCIRGIPIEVLLSQSYELVRESNIRFTKDVFGKKLTSRQKKKLEKKYLGWINQEKNK